MHPRVTKETETLAKEYVLSKGWEYGHTYRMSHAECGDTRRRLYITTNKSVGSALLWCHNCSHWGAIYKGLGPRTRPIITVDTTKPIRLEDMELRDINWIAVDSGGYLSKYLSEETIRNYGIQWEANTKRLHYPIRDINLNLIGGQLRLPPQHVSATPMSEIKFLTWKENENTNLQQVIQTGMAHGMMRCSETLVIVEDVLSALKIAREVRWADALPLLCTSMDPRTAVMIRERNYTTVLVWLDNDNAHVVKAADRIVALLSNMGIAYVGCVTNVIDPKASVTVRETLDNRLLEVLNDTRSPVTPMPTLKS